MFSDINEEGPTDKINEFGLRDKTDQSSGLQQINPYTIQKILMEYSVTADTRDCVGAQSLVDAQAYAESIGIRSAASGLIVNTTGIGIEPIVVTFDSVGALQDGDTIFIKDVTGNKAVNGQNVVNNIKS